MLVPHLVNRTVRCRLDSVYKGSSTKVFKRGYSPVHSTLAYVLIGGLGAASVSLLRGSQILGTGQRSPWSTWQSPGL